MATRRDALVHGDVAGGDGELELRVMSPLGELQFVGGDVQVIHGDFRRFLVCDGVALGRVTRSWRGLDSGDGLPRLLLVGDGVGSGDGGRDELARDGGRGHGGGDVRRARRGALALGGLLEALEKRGGVRGRWARRGRRVARRGGVRHERAFHAGLAGGGVRRGAGRGEGSGDAGKACGGGGRWRRACREAQAYVRRGSGFARLIPRRFLLSRGSRVAPDAETAHFGTCM